MLNIVGYLTPPNTLIMALTTFDYAALLTIAGAAAYLYSHRRDNLPLPPGPRKLPLVQAYQRLYYEDRIKPEFEKRWAEQKEDQAKAVASGETLMKTSGLMLKLLKEVAAELWENEIEEVREAVILAVEKDLEDQKQRKTKAEEGPDTPEDYQV